MPDQASEPRLDVRAMSKTFGATRVLRDVDLVVQAGEVHGVAGQNGSGKSTLIKILTGYQHPDGGASYRIDGQDIHLPVRWPDVHRAGISVVHQDLGLVDRMSVAENIWVGGFPTDRLRRIDRGRRDATAADVLARLYIELDPRMPVGLLSAALRAEVAIARALRDQVPGRGLVILDESTRTLSGHDLTRVHQIIRRIADDGGSVVLISHSMPELLQITDRITVLRDGAVAGQALVTAEQTEATVARRLLGDSATAATIGGPPSATAAPSPAGRVVRIRGLQGRATGPVDLDVGAGQVVGITGLSGAGYETLPYLMTGASPATSGRIELGAGAPVELTRATVRSCIRRGVLLVPESRELEGLAFDLPVRDNVNVPALHRRGRPWFVGRRWQQREFAAAVSELDIRPGDPAMLVKQLSGGNQQKVLLSKWMTQQPQLLVLHEPTQAVDVGARAAILAAVRKIAADGVAVVVVSADLNDLIDVADRICIHSPTGGLQETASRSVDEILGLVYASTPALTTLAAPALAGVATP